MSKKIAFRNKSPTGWWIASYIERPVRKDEKKPSPRNRCLVWENTIILRAPNRDAAYKKAIKLASQGQQAFSNEKGLKLGRWKFVGLTDLLPIYEELEDGAEILWSEYAVSFSALKRKVVKKKNQLSVFDDTPAIGDRAD